MKSSGDLCVLARLRAAEQERETGQRSLGGDELVLRGNHGEPDPDAFVTADMGVVSVDMGGGEAVGAECPETLLERSRSQVDCRELWGFPYGLIRTCGRPVRDVEGMSVKRATRCRVRQAIHITLLASP
ncbi:hypothetical protein ACM01_33060 [Streptomyces viridochromogenes]|uniref:Uncharacterized protein n=1 Tax=Streptomyces viridochromogenes TaxID=1938 RepID=A0A0J8BWN3_STRVR|nr:hypothetical protein ACM01_33060 [Streptomyces viridochromogenes]